VTRTVWLLMFIALAVLPHTAFVQGPPAGRARGVGANPGAAPAEAPPPRATPPGPHAVAIESYPSLAMHTVYHPANLGAFGPSKGLPIVSWGNGGCSRNGLAFSTFLTQIAAHGYLAIAIGPKEAAAGGGRRGQGAGGAAPTTRPIDDQMLLDAVDWAIRQSGDPSSPLHRRIDTSKVAVMGQSCGGLQAIAVSHDPRVTTTMVWNSGLLPEDGSSPAMALSTATKDSLNRLHGPVAYIIGGPSDVAYPNAEDDFARITTVPVFKANLNVGHGGTYRDPGGGWFGEVGVAWLDWQLKGSSDASRWFVGRDCRLCTNPIWTIAKKGMP
jgi:hypothetical protein